MEENMALLEELNELCTKVGEIADDAQRVYEAAVVARKHSEEIDQMISECLALIEK